ncbi:MAG TPA: hypothetical protein VMI34_14795 [Candidatus Bathyarchaeia archaeon]|nr:hypothetical protein [Candidatus Bathyarchaeia archaeon]
MFAREASREAVTTRVHFHAQLDVVWRGILFYEDVLERPPFPLRAVLPRPLRTDGDKTRAGSEVHCVYAGGGVVKRITAVEPARLLQFDVVEQSLGIESCVLAQSGAYRFFLCGEGTDVVLVTNYLAYLHPRRLWRPLEALLTRQLHRHILAAVRTALGLPGPPTRADLGPSCRPESPGGLACTTSRSRSHW